MKSKAAVRRIVEALKTLYPDAMCSLQYQKDYELLFAVRLSAQCTDARVNMVTPALYARFPTLEAFANASYEEVGEGWFLTGEMAELLTSGTPNIVCIQPFACLPNHVVGKGVIKALRKSYPWANIVAVDYDPGASEVNQLNRIKLMLSSARRAMHSGATQDAEALPIAR